MSAVISRERGGARATKMGEGARGRRRFRNMESGSGQVLLKPAVYFFGVIFGFVSLSMQDDVGRKSLYDGFNGAAFGTVFALAACGILVSFVLEYLDNFAKCFVNTLSMLVVGVVHATTSAGGLRLPLVIGIVLTSVAIEQCNLSQSYAKLWRERCS